MAAGETIVGGIAYEARIKTAEIRKDALEVEAIARKAGDGLNEGVSQGAGKAEKALGLLKKASKIAFVAFGAAAVAGIGASIKSAGEFESSLSKLRQASGATGDELASMSGLARQLGKDNSLAGVTAAGAAEAMVELSKAGLSVNDTMAASKGVLSLAKAGNLEFAEAATIAASALNAFGLQGADATKVADALAAGANASQADLGDLALGLQQSATVAKQFNLSLDSTVTALALFANNGIRGSDAGTSLKTMLISLAKPSVKAAEAMQAIGFNAYDAEGRFVGLEEMSMRLKKSLTGLTDEQKQNTLATIFGTDAFRAAAVLADNAGESYTNMSKAVGEVGAANKAAAAQMGPFQRAVENVSNQMSEVALQVGQKVLPVLTKLAEGIGGNVGPAFDKFKNLAKRALDVLMPAIQGLGNAITTRLIPAMAQIARSQIVQALGIGFVGALYAAMRAVEGLIRIASSLMGVLNGLAPLVIGIAAAFATYRAVVGGVSLAITAYQTAVKIATAAQVAFNLALMANPIGLAIGAVVGLTAAFVAITAQEDKTTTAAQRLNTARRDAKTATDNAKLSEDALRGALLTQEGATLAAEGAQRRYNDAVRMYGVESFEARQAAYDLKRAEEEKARAIEDSKNKTVDHNNKMAEKTRLEEENKKKQKEWQDQVVVTTGRIGDQNNTIDLLTGKLNNLNGKTFSYTVKELESIIKNGVSSPKAKADAEALLRQQLMQRRALGGPVTAGQPYFVGENSDGTLNSTSELFIPRRSGTIISSKDLQKSLGSKGGDTSINMNLNLSGIYADSPAAKRRLGEDILSAVNDGLKAQGVPVSSLVGGGRI